jgi:hypothetical protein
MTERELLVDCLRLNACHVDYMLTESMASNFWGIPRTTHDLDFVVALDQSAIASFVKAFEPDFFIQESSVRAAFNPPYQFNALDNRSALKVDFWVLRQESFERQMFARRRREDLFGEPAWVSTAEDVLLHKLYWNKLSPSDRQLGDAAGIVAVQKDALDEAYLCRWASELGVEETLRQLLRGEIRPKLT